MAFRGLRHLLALGVVALRIGNLSNRGMGDRRKSASSEKIDKNKEGVAGKQNLCYDCRSLELLETSQRGK